MVGTIITSVDVMYGWHRHPQHALNFSLQTHKLNGYTACTPRVNYSYVARCFIACAVPVIRGADIIAQTTIELTPGEPMSYYWERHGFKIDVPAGAVSTESGPVTLSVQASLSGDYQLPDDQALVSGVYWLALHPPVKLAEKVTISIQHCVSVKDANDHALIFVTAKCTQKTLPYTFKPLPGGIFSESEYGGLSVDHFSGFGVSSDSDALRYSICTYYMYISKFDNCWDVHICVTQKKEVLIEV